MDIFKKKKRRFPYEFRKVVQYMKDKRGISVILGESTEFLGFYDRNIIIHHNYDLRNNGLHMLLYECGKTFQPTTNIGINSYKEIDKELFPDEYKVGTILADADAWARGMELAKKLKIQIDKKKYKDSMNKTLIENYKKELWK